MEAAICTRCQSSNPIFTKFCLTCGLEITAAMRRTISVSTSGATVSAPVAQTQQTQSSTQQAKNPEQSAPVGDNSNSPETGNEPSPQKEGSRWFKGSRWFGRS